MKLYEFTVSGAYDNSLNKIREIAYSSAAQQNQFEQEMGEPGWPRYVVLLVSGRAVDPDTNQYLFEVHTK